MAINMRNRSKSVVSKAGGGPVVSGRKKSWGKVIGEGGSNRALPASGRSNRVGSAPVPRKDDYSDFGFDDDQYRVTEVDSEDDYDDDYDFEDQFDSPSLNTAAPRARTDGMIRQRQDEFNLVAYLLRAIGLAVGCLAPCIFLGGLYYAATMIIGRDLIFLQWWILPLLLAFYCGYKAGGIAKKNFRFGKSPLPVALMAAILSSLAIGAALYAGGWFISLYPSEIIAQKLDLPYEFFEIGMRVDEFIHLLFDTFKLATYTVIPLAGAGLGWTFKNK